MTKNAQAGRRRRVIWLCGAALAVLIAGGVGGRRLLRSREKAPATPSKDRYFEVRRGDFNISVTLDGNLDAIKRHDLSYTGTGRYGLEIIEVVEDRTRVEKGDAVLRFSEEKYKEELDRLKLSLEDEHKNLRLSEEDLQMTRVDNVNAIKFASDLLRTSKDALTKYEELDAPRKKRELLDAIAAAEQKVSEARRTVELRRAEVSAAHMGDESKLEQLQKKVTESEKQVEQAEAERDKAYYSLRIFKRYDHVEKLRGLRESVTKNWMSLQRDIVQAAGNEIKKEREILNLKKRIDQLGEDIKRVSDDMDKLTLRAPVSGIVSLGQPQRHHWGRQKEIKIGEKVSAREVVATIPDLSKFMVAISLPEEFRSTIREGLRATLRSKAIPDLVLDGEVEKIAPMATHMIYWDRNSPKVYSTKIKTQGSDERLMPGMTMRVEIIVEEVKDVCFVPVEALYNREGHTYCKVKTATVPEERKVETGRSSNDYVEILEGLEEGENVLLHRQQQAG